MLLGTIFEGNDTEHLLDDDTKYTENVTVKSSKAKSKKSKKNGSPKYERKTKLLKGNS